MLKAVERLRMLSIIHTEYGVRVSRNRRSTTVYLECHHN